MTTTWERLQRAFVEDHRAMTRGYRDLIEQLLANDFEAAGRAASRLDSIAGPHIEFEERFLYPLIGRSRGDTYLSRLYDEHEEVVDVLSEILAVLTQQSQPQKPQLAPQETPQEGTVRRWIAQLRGGIDHASACGTLLNEIQSLAEDEQLRFLDGLARLREQGNRWTELQGLHPLSTSSTTAERGTLLSGSEAQTTLT